jgi:hypothetical protein
MALSDSKIMFWNGKVPSKSIHFDVVTDKDHTEQQQAPAPTAVPTLCGMPLKYISYVFPLCLAPEPFSVGRGLWTYGQSLGQTILTFSSQFNHLSSSECCPFIAHALLARFDAPITCIFRSIRSSCDRTP